MTELLPVALVTLLAVVSPGADFAMVTRNSYLHGRGAGLLAAAGIALGVQLHVLYTVLGVGLLIAASPALFTAIKLVGAAYLVYIGYQTFVQRALDDADLAAQAAPGAFGSLRSGFMSNALNPKTTLFVVSAYAQVVHADTPVAAQIGYGLFISATHWIWFSLVALFFSNRRLRGAMLRAQSALNKVIGTVLVGLGLTLALAPMAT